MKFLHTISGRRLIVYIKPFRTGQPELYSYLSLIPALDQAGNPWSPKRRLAISSLPPTTEHLHLLPTISVSLKCGKLTKQKINFKVRASPILFTDVMSIPTPVRGLHPVRLLFRMSVQSCL